jgi:Spy/CpxP family protein refolding chaperone
MKCTSHHTVRLSAACTYAVLFGAAVVLLTATPLAAQTPPVQGRTLLAQPAQQGRASPDEWTLLKAYQRASAENQAALGRLASALRTSDPLAGAFFPPELVMKHQQAIGLTAAQRAAIVGAITAAQPRFIEAQWQLEPETTLLAELVRAERVDEARVLQQIDRVLELERQVKRQQIELLVRIKNQLTVEQQRQLTRLGGSSQLRYSPGGAFEPRAGGVQYQPRSEKFDLGSTAFTMGTVKYNPGGAPYTVRSVPIESVKSDLGVVPFTIRKQ